MIQRNTSRWAMLTILYLCILAYALVFQSIPPVLSLIIDDLNISHAQAGLLMSIFALPGIIISIPAGFLADHYGAKRIGIFSFLLMIGGTLILATGHTFPLLVLGRLIAGIGGITLALTCMRAVAQWFMNREIGLAMGLYTTGMPVGIIIALNALAAVGATWSWRSSIWVTVIVSCLALVAFALFFMPASTAPRKGFFSGLGQTGLPIWLLGAAWGCFNAAAISLFTFAPDFMVRSGLDLRTAGFNTSLVMMAALVLNPLIGYLLDKVGHKEMFIGVGGLGMTLLLLQVPGGINWIVSLMVIIGVVQALIPPSVFSLVPDVVNTERLGLGLGIIYTINNLGMLIGPYIVGLSHDVTGSYQTGFRIMSFFAILVTVNVALLWFRRRADSRLSG